MGLMRNMNDFTKEELQYINDYIFKGASFIRMDKHDIIKDKIQSMIDNYCEHEASDAHYEQFRWNLCSKCGAQYK